MKTVLITGGTSGIGRACARLFAGAGFRLIVTGRRAHLLEDLARELALSEDRLMTGVLDVRNSQKVEDFVNSIPPPFSEVDVLVNNAGLALGRSPIHEGEIEDWDVMIDTNIKGLLYVTRAMARKMVNRKSGHIINIGSIAGKEVYPGGNVYCATKHAVDALTKGFRMDLMPHGIKVSSVNPGHVLTEFALVRFKQNADAADAVYEGFKPLSDIEVAETVLWVATAPHNVNILDLTMTCRSQANSWVIDRNPSAT